MPNTITIQGLRNIQRLEFDVPGPGVWLLTGPNGVGKTTLLACLRRYRNKNAFQRHFPTATRSRNLDAHDNASITYNVAGRTVTYSYRTERWPPTPKAHSKLIETAYPAVKYIAANADRIEPRREELTVNRVRPANAEIIGAANRIFVTEKFNDLRVVNVARGGRVQAYLLELPPIGRSRQFFSEKHFSLGELVILNLLKTICALPQFSLLLIDEIELALHPIAQAELLTYLQEIAAQRHLTVLLSTHSASLIKQASRSTVLLLERTDGEVTCQAGCFPSYVLGAIAYGQDVLTDAFVYVEDEAASAFLEELISEFITTEIGVASLTPTYHVIPVGSWNAALKFFDRQRPRIPAHSRAKLVLDADAPALIQAAQQQRMRDLEARNRADISYLPFVPEVGLVNLLRTDLAGVRDALRVHYRNNAIALRQVDIGQLPMGAGPDVCKAVVRRAAGAISNIVGAPDRDVGDVLMRILAQHHYRNDRNAMRAFVGPLIR